MLIPMACRATVFFIALAISANSSCSRDNDILGEFELWLSWEERVEVQEDGRDGQTRLSLHGRNTKMEKKEGPGFVGM